MKTFPESNQDWLNEDLSKKWKRIRYIRSLVLLEIEEARNKNIIKSSLQAVPKISMTEFDKNLFDGVNAADIFITSNVSFTVNDVATPSVEIQIAEGNKCERCWKILPEVKEEEICNRCNDVVKRNFK